MNVDSPWLRGNPTGNRHKSPLLRVGMTSTCVFFTVITIGLTNSFTTDISSGAHFNTALWAESYPDNRRYYTPEIPGVFAVDFVDSYNLYFQRNGQASDVDGRGSLYIEREWSNPGHLADPYPQPDPVAAGNFAYNEGLFRRTLSLYERGLEDMRTMEEQIGVIAEARNRIQNPLWWKQVDALSQLQRRERNARETAARSISTYMRRAYETLLNVDDLELRETDRYRDLLKLCYRQYAIYQVGLRNHLSALDALRAYARLPDTESEWPLHYYLSICYNAQLRMAVRDTGVPEDRLRAIRRLQHIHHLRAVELKFGRSSQQYRETFERIRRADLASPRSTAFPDALD
ncbi:MAG: hypothetical protein KDK30_13765 [Leptospiraceae bacterium]|nr:hypothetical protein [Leptospiraceae bacterium]